MNTPLWKFVDVVRVALGRVLVGIGLLAAPLVLVTVGAGVAHAAGTTGFSVSPPITISSTSENCKSLVVGKHTPKVFINGTGTFLAGQTIDYTLSLSPAATAPYNDRVCVVTEDIGGTYVATLGEAQFGGPNNTGVPVPPYGGGFSFTYKLPSLGTVGSGKGQAYQVCSVSKTQKPVNGGGADRKAGPDCHVIPNPHLTIKKTPISSPVGTNSKLGFDITVSSTGSTDANDFVMTDNLPTNLGLSGTWADTVTSGTGNCSIASNVLTCYGDHASSPGLLKAGESFTVEVFSNSGANGTGTVDNTAVASATSVPQVQDEASITVQQNQPAVVSAVKSEGSSPGAGVAIDPFDPTANTITYQITLTNSGPVDATGVAVSDPVPAGTTFLSSPDGTLTSGKVQWSDLTVTKNGGTDSVSFTVTVNSSDTNGQTIDNVATYSVGQSEVVETVQSGTPGITCTSTTSCDTNHVQNPVKYPVVTGAKSSSPKSGSTVKPGQDVVYTITLSNAGLAASPAVTVTDAVPTGTTFVSADSGGTDTAGTVTWTGIVVPAAPGTKSVSFTVKVNSTDKALSIPNVADFTNVHTVGCGVAATCPTNKVTVAVPAPTSASTATTTTTPTTTTPTTTSPTTAASSTTTAPKSALAFTGADIVKSLGVAVGALGSGLFLLVATRRRRSGA